MESGKTLLPLVVTASAGAARVSPPFSIVPEKLAEHTEAFGQAVMQLIAAPVGGQDQNADSIGHRLEDVSHSLDQIYQDANDSAQSINFAASEVFRQHFELGMHFFEALAVARGPLEVLNLQFNFFSAQFGLLAEQSKELQHGIAKTYLLPAARAFGSATVAEPAAGRSGTLLRP